MIAVLLCWSVDARGRICGALLKWTARADGYSATCSKCKCQTRAVTGVVLELDALEVLP